MRTSRVFLPHLSSSSPEVSQKFIDRYDIKDKEVIEIGCGKGDFINLLSELGDNNGIGIDPAWVPGRSKENPKVRFIKEFYSEKHGDLKADCIVCRHTLEHIHDTYGFMETIRKSITDNEKVVIFFEIPSIVRILKIQAFWDIFYEHSTYLSPGSLGRLFRATGFEVLDMYLLYDDQYLFIEAKPVDGISDKIHPLEESVEELKELTKFFVEQIRIQLDSWREKLEGFKADNKKVVIWGGGSKSVGFLTQFHDVGVIKHVVDINPHMSGNYIPGVGIQYVVPEFLADYQPDVVIVMNSVYMDEIGKMLHGMGVEPLMLGL